MKNIALIIFLDSKGLVLLQQKTYDAPNWPGVWSLFGGLVEAGENPLEAALREAKEELGLELSADDLSFFKEFPSPDKNRSVFIAKIPDHTKLVLQEGRGLGFFRKEETEHLEMPEHIQEILRTYFRSI
mgnify:FL=1